LSSPEQEDATSIARTTVAGVLDPQWGEDGSITTDLSPWRIEIEGRGDGSLFAVGDRELGGSRQVGVGRFTPSGVPDPGFGLGGFASIGGSGAILRGRTVFALDASVGPKGPVLSLSVNDPDLKNSTRYRLIRLDNTGKLDTTFGKGGIVETATATSALAHDAQGRLVTLNSSATGTVTLARRRG
jgi:hypothetical protein